MSKPLELQVAPLVERIGPILAGKNPSVQGAVLADLVATWVAGHVIRGDRTTTDEMRAKIIECHIQAVREFIPLNAKLLGTDR